MFKKHLCDGKALNEFVYTRAYLLMFLLMNTKQFTTDIPVVGAWYNCKGIVTSYTL